MWGSSGSADGQRSREVMTLPREVVHIVGAIVVGHVVTLAGVVALLVMNGGPALFQVALQVAILFGSVGFAVVMVATISIVWFGQDTTQQLSRRSSGSGLRQEVHEGDQYPSQVSRIMRKMFGGYLVRWLIPVMVVLMAVEIVSVGVALVVIALCEMLTVLGYRSAYKDYVEYKRVSGGGLQESGFGNRR